MDYSQPFGTVAGSAYVNGNPATGTAGSIPPAGAFEYPQRELVNIVSDSSLTPSNADLYQVIKALRYQRMNFYVASGTVNALTVSSRTNTAVATLLAGLPIRVECTGTNTIAPTLQVDGTSSRPIVYPDNVALSAGELKNTKIIEVIYSQTLDKYMMVSRSDSSGSKSAPFYGFVALPATTFNVGSSGGAATYVTTYGSTSNGLSAAVFSGGVLTIGAGDDGYYTFSTWLGTNLLVPGTGGAANPYGFSGAIDLSTDGGSTFFSIAGLGGVMDANAVKGPFLGGQAVRRLSAGDKLKVGVLQNSGVTQNFPMGLSAVFLGK